MKTKTYSQNNNNIVSIATVNKREIWGTNEQQISFFLTSFISNNPEIMLACVCVTYGLWERTFHDQLLPFCGSLFLRWLTIGAVHFLDSSHDYHYDKNRQEKRQHKIWFRITWKNNTQNSQCWMIREAKINECESSCGIHWL